MRGRVVSCVSPVGLGERGGVSDVVAAVQVRACDDDLSCLVRCEVQLVCGPEAEGHADPRLAGLVVADAVEGQPVEQQDAALGHGDGQRLVGQAGVLVVLVHPGTAAVGLRHADVREVVRAGEDVGASVLRCRLLQVEGGREQPSCRLQDVAVQARLALRTVGVVHRRVVVTVLDEHDVRSEEPDERVEEQWVGDELADEVGVAVVQAVQLDDRFLAPQAATLIFLLLLAQDELAEFARLVGAQHIRQAQVAHVSEEPGLFV